MILLKGGVSSLKVRLNLMAEGNYEYNIVGMYIEDEDGDDSEITPVLPKGESNKPLDQPKENPKKEEEEEEENPLKADYSEEFKREQANKPKIRTYKDELRDFFFGTKKRHQYGPDCECGKDVSGDFGKHSDWCPRYNKYDD